MIHFISYSQPRLPVIIVKELAKTYGDKLAVRNLTFSVHAGEIVGFLGPNGAGKSTTVKVLTGLIRPTSGSASVAGKDILTEPLEVKKRIGYVPETGALFETLSAWEYLQFVAELHHLDRAAADIKMEELLTLFGLFQEKDQRMREYSKGMKQKILICSAVLHNPEVLFLDEPLDGLDANAAFVFKEVLRGLAAQGKAILFCSHILDVVERLCPRIIIIDKGVMITQGTPAAIAQSTGTTSLEEAFCQLTGVRDVRDSASEFLQALGS
jgi:ABC-2 type transport system ATP-binding protein